MDRMKTFFLYFLAVVVCYFGSNSLIYAGINNMYEEIKDYNFAYSDKVEVTINEAKSTSVNGYVKGTITNISNSKVNKEYIIIDLYSDQYTKMGTKTIKVENLNAKKSIDFDVDFRYANVKYCIIYTE